MVRKECLFSKLTQSLLGGGKDVKRQGYKIYGVIFVVGYQQNSDFLCKHMPTRDTFLTLIYIVVIIILYLLQKGHSLNVPSSMK